MLEAVSSGSDHPRIWLQPACCADPDVGRLWCEDDEPVACEDGVPWTEYRSVADVVRVLDERIAELERAFVPSSVLVEAKHEGQLIALRSIRSRFTEED